jgi:hypothetical protein
MFAVSVEVILKFWFPAAHPFTTWNMAFHVRSLERFQSKALRMAFWYMPNMVIRRDLQIPTVKEEIHHYSSKYSARLRAHRNVLIVNHIELSHNKQAIAKTPAKWSAYQIPSVIVVFVMLVLRFSWSHSQKPQQVLNLLVTEERYWALYCMPLYMLLHNLLNVLVQIANKMGLQKKCKIARSLCLYSLMGVVLWYMTSCSQL